MPSEQIVDVAYGITVGDAASDVAEDVDGQHAVGLTQGCCGGEPDHRRSAGARKKQDRRCAGQAALGDAGGAETGVEIVDHGAAWPFREERVVRGVEGAPLVGFCERCAW